tara:strand:+ start:324 stop:530 length:207 start_codon:yes stop_codon:yes gene_type:complete
MIQIHGITFNIEWDKFKRSSSFFIPCLNSKEAKRVLRIACKHKKYKVRMKVVIENKVRGVRVWRLEDD